MKVLIMSGYEYQTKLSGTDPVVLLDPGENFVDQTVWMEAHEHPRVASQVDGGMLIHEGLWHPLWFARFKAAVDDGKTGNDLPTSRTLGLDDLEACLRHEGDQRYLRALLTIEQRGGAVAIIKNALGIK